MIIRSVGELSQHRPLYSTTCDATVTEACRALHDRHIGALAVLDGDRLVGIISERDVVSRVIVGERAPDTTLVREIMTPDPETIDAHDGLTDALQKMLAGHFRHLPVTRDGQAVGMISMRDIPAEYRLMYQRYKQWREEAHVDEI